MSNPSMAAMPARCRLHAAAAPPVRRVAAQGGCARHSRALTCRVTVWYWAAASRASSAPPSTAARRMSAMQPLARGYDAHRLQEGPNRGRAGRRFVTARDQQQIDRIARGQHAGGCTAVIDRNRQCAQSRLDERRQGGVGDGFERGERDRLAGLQRSCQGSPQCCPRRLRRPRRHWPGISRARHGAPASMVRARIRQRDRGPPPGRLVMRIVPSAVPAPRLPVRAGIDAPARTHTPR